MDRKWEQLTPDERQEERFKLWLSPKGVQFASPQAEQTYKARVKRLIDALQLRVPDRVPVSLAIGFFPAYYAGITPQDLMYDYEKLVKAWQKFYRDFEIDTLAGPWIVPGTVFEILDYKLYRWPGHGVSPDASYQCVEAEYMKEDEYDALIEDPSDFWLRVYLPRIFGRLEPLRKLAPLTDVIEMPFTTPNFAQYGMEDVVGSLLALIEAGKEARKWVDAGRQFSRKMIESGIPGFAGGAPKAPFDCIGDTLRGTQGIVMDMYRRPEKLIEAMERFVPIEIKMGVRAANASGIPVIYMPLHKGADGFMSARQFDTFYWPTLKKVVMGLINEGIAVRLFAEGGFNSRLEAIKDLPRGKVAWHFDRTDMARAKEVLGDTACIMGNVPASLLYSGTPQSVKDYCKKLIETAGKGGGFILATGSVTDEARPENLQALINAAKEYGTYGK